MFLVGAVALLLAGCKHDHPATQPTAAPSQVSFLLKPGAGDPRDPQPAPGAMVRLTIFLIDLPAGTVSDNPDFWKRVDELAVGAANHDRLLRNGVRCGLVSSADGAYFSRFFDSHPRKLTVSHVDGFRDQTIPLQMDRYFEREDLFIFNESGRIEGKTFDRATNQLMLSFGASLNDAGSVWLRLCPQVRCEKLRLEYSALSQEFESPEKDVEHLYDVGLNANIPQGSFLIVAPGTDADRNTSIGGRFFTTSSDTDRGERVLVIVPSLLPLDGSAVKVEPPLMK